MMSNTSPHNNNWTELPFRGNTINDNISQITETHHDTTLHRNYPHLQTQHLFRELPFYSCTEYEIIVNCLTSHNKFLELLANNNLSNEIFRQLPEMKENFKCTYQTENSFQNLIKKHSSNSLKVFHQNIRSLNKNKLILKSFLDSLNCNFDLIFITETGNAQPNEIEEIFKNYKFYIDAPIAGKGSKGGAGILVNTNSFDSIEEIFENENLKHNCKCTNCKIENKWLKLKTKKNTYIAGSVYRHPNANSKHFIESLEKQLNKLDKKSTCIIAGDINIDLTKQQNSNVKMYLETLLEYNFLPYICIPTRITDNSATIIDHINVRIPVQQIHNKISSGNLINDISDHLPNYFIIDQEMNTTRERPLIRLYNEKNIKHFKRNIQQEPLLLPHPRSNNSNTLLAEFNFNLNRLLNKYFPLIRLSRKKFKEKKYITNEIKNMIKERNKLFNIYTNDRNTPNKKKWIDMRNKTNQAIKNSEIKLYKTQIDKHGNNCQAMWKTLNHILSKKNNKKTNINSLLVNQKLLTTQSDISEGLNNFFCNIGENLASHFDNIETNDFRKYLKQPANQSMYVHKILNKEITNHINQLDSKKSAGHDGFTAKFLKVSSPIIVDSLTEIFNNSISTGNYPDEMKIAKCIPIYKKGKRNDPSNYRPISILSTINKIFEKILYTRLYKYLTKFDILYNYQYGFRKNHSTIQALIEITDYLKTAIDEKKIVSGIFLDLTKAFDTVNHNILLAKLHNYGIRGVANDLLRSYLTNRYQYVSIGNTSSSKQPIKCGVPQGSVLGPLLFLIYINDIANCSKIGKIRIFADDTSAFVEGTKVNEVISNSEILMNDLNNWFKSNKLTLSTNKSCFILFRSAHTRLNEIPSVLNFGDSHINRENSVKYLGITLDENLNWNEHVQQVCKSLKSCFGTFYNVRNYLNLDQVRTIYYSLVYSKIKYALAVYGNTSNENIQLIQCLQNKLIKVLMKKNYRYPTYKLHNELNILKVEDLVDQEILTFVFNFINKKLPNVFSSYFKYRSENQQPQTRNIDNHLITPKPRTNCGEQTIRVKGALLWNKLPTSLTKLTNSKTFRKTWKESKPEYT